MLIDVELIARTGAIRILLHALGEGPLEMAPMLSSAFLHLADSPRTREYLHIGTDLEVCIEEYVYAVPAHRFCYRRWRCQASLTHTVKALNTRNECEV